MPRIDIALLGMRSVLIGDDMYRSVNSAGDGSVSSDDIQDCCMLIMPPWLQAEKTTSGADMPISSTPVSSFEGAESKVCTNLLSTSNQAASRDRVVSSAVGNIRLRLESMMPSATAPSLLVLKGRSSHELKSNPRVAEISAALLVFDIVLARLC